MREARYNADRKKLAGSEEGRKKRKSEKEDNDFFKHCCKQNVGRERLRKILLTLKKKHAQHS